MQMMCLRLCCCVVDMTIEGVKISDSLLYTLSVAIVGKNPIQKGPQGIPIDIDSDGSIEIIVVVCVEFRPAGSETRIKS